MHPWSPLDPNGTTAAEAKPRYAYSISNPHGQIKIMWSAELRIYNLKKTSPPQSRSQAVVCVSTPGMYLRSGYFLVDTNTVVVITLNNLTCSDFPNTIFEYGSL